MAHGENVLFPSASGPVPAIEYSCADPTCAVIMCPGSSGGMGPGIAKMHRGLGLDKRGTVAAFGSIYTRLGVELSSDVDADSWDPPRLSGKATTVARASAVLTPPLKPSPSSHRHSQGLNLFSFSGHPEPSLSHGCALLYQCP
jgi:hypothetical protein